VEDAFSLPTICQRLFYRGQELEDNSVTVESLKIFANDAIYVREVEEIINITSDSEVSPSREQRRKERPGFSGTVLGSADVSWCSSPTSTPPVDQRDKTCLACTFSNTCDALHCQICDTPFVWIAENRKHKMRSVAIAFWDPDHLNTIEDESRLQSWSIWQPKRKSKQMILIFHQLSLKRESSPKLITLQNKKKKIRGDAWWCVKRMPKSQYPRRVPVASIDL